MSDQSSEASEPPRRGILLVSVGTDHHPFNRLIEWVETWHANQPAWDLIVQHGTSRPSANADNHQMMPHEDFMAVVRRADAIVCQGGPGGMMDVRSQGKCPIVVPRDPAKGEHVDGHQLDFANHAANKGLAAVARSQAELFELLDETTPGGDRWAIDVDRRQPPGVSELSRVLAEPPHKRTGVLRRMRIMWRLRPKHRPDTIKQDVTTSDGPGL